MQILSETKARTFPYFSALKSISFISLQQNYNLILCFLWEEQLLDCLFTSLDATWYKYYKILKMINKVHAEHVVVHTEQIPLTVESQRGFPIIFSTKSKCLMMIFRILNKWVPPYLSLRVCLFSVSHFLLQPNWRAWIFQLVTRILKFQYLCDCFHSCSKTTSSPQFPYDIHLSFLK